MLDFGHAAHKPRDTACYMKTLRWDRTFMHCIIVPFDGISYKLNGLCMWHRIILCLFRTSYVTHAPRVADSCNRSKIWQILILEQHYWPLSGRVLWEASLQTRQPSRPHIAFATFRSLPQVVPPGQVVPVKRLAPQPHGQRRNAYAASPDSWRRSYTSNCAPRFPTHKPLLACVTIIHCKTNEAVSTFIDWGSCFQRRVWWSSLRSCYCHRFVATTSERVMIAWSTSGSTSEALKVCPNGWYDWVNDRQVQYIHLASMLTYKVCTVKKCVWHNDLLMCMVCWHCQFHR